MKILLKIYILILLSVISGCSDYKGEYGDIQGKYIEVKDKTIYISEPVNGTFESNFGNILSKTESGNIVVLKGETDYSGGSGSMYGITVKPGQERHWTRPFTATINKKENTIQFEGVLIISSLDMRTWNVTLKKK